MLDLRHMAAHTRALSVPKDHLLGLCCDLNFLQQHRSEIPRVSVFSECLFERKTWTLEMKLPQITLYTLNHDASYVNFSCCVLVYL